MPVAALLLLLAAVETTPPALAPEPSAGSDAPADRGGPWSFGVGLGFGDGHTVSGAERRRFSDVVGLDPTRLFLQAEVARSVARQLRIGLDATLAAATGEETDPSLGLVTRTLRVANLDVVATFSPVETGFFFRGGGGLSAIRVDASSSTLDVREAHGGLNLLGGVGWAIPLGLRADVRIDLDASRQWYPKAGADAPSGSFLWALYAGVDWR